jgi:hypothetical protein
LNGLSKIIFIALLLKPASVLTQDKFKKNKLFLIKMDIIVKVCRMLYALAMFIFGVEHLICGDFTAAGLASAICVLGYTFHKVL